MSRSDTILRRSLRRSLPSRRRQMYRRRNSRRNARRSKEIETRRYKGVPVEIAVQSTDARKRQRSPMKESVPAEIAVQSTDTRKRQRSPMSAETRDLPMFRTTEEIWEFLSKFTRGEDTRYEYLEKADVGDNLFLPGCKCGQFHLKSAEILKYWSFKNSAMDTSGECRLDIMAPKEAIH